MSTVSYTHLFPIGYFLSRLRVNKQHIMLMLVMLPMWMNFLLRTYASVSYTHLICRA